MSEPNWMAPEELRAVADYCETLVPLWDALTSGPRGGISIEMLSSLDVKVHDANGDVLGTINWGDSGPAFFASEGCDDASA